MRFFFLVIGPLLLLWAACEPTQSSSPEPALSSEIYVRYLENQRITQAEAVIYQLDSTENLQPITLKNGVFFQGGAMELRELPPPIQFQYKSERSGDFPDTFSFRLGLAAGDQPVNISMAPLMSAEFSTDGKGAIIDWFGDDLQKEEQLIVLVADRSRNTQRLEFPGPLAPGKLLVNEKALKKLTAPPVRVDLVRSRTLSRTEGRVQIQATLEYYKDDIPLSNP